LKVASIPLVYRHINYASDFIGDKNTARHIDHQLEHAHRRKAWNVYCPERWIVGQAEGKSDIAGKHQKKRIWQR
jgi:hypothetical protein